MKELVSIIVPVYNVEGLICETMDCVRAQTWQCWELLLVEDGSSDGTIQVIKRYMEEKGDERIRLIRQPRNLGTAQARNRGLLEDSGRYNAYLD